jgi:YwiC-like protein
MNALRRYKIILPSEHGSWAMLATPFIIGAGVAGRLPLALWVCAAAALALFLLRQPVTLLVRVLRGKARPDDAGPAWLWSGLLAVIAIGCGVGLVGMGRAAILWLAIPAGVIMALTVALGAWLGPRRLGVELLGVSGLAMAAPAAYAAASGDLNATAWLTWLIGAAHSVITVLYVRLRIDELHGRASRAQRIAVVAAHGLALAAVIAGIALRLVPALILLPVGLLLLRALYVGWRRPRLDSVKRFGLAETAFALAFAGLVIAAFVIHS